MTTDNGLYCLLKFFVSFCDTFWVKRTLCFSPDIIKRTLSVSEQKLSFVDMINRRIQLHRVWLGHGGESAVDLKCITDLMRGTSYYTEWNRI